jgi:uncharacterized membrane protein required for colicin V production
VNIGDFVRSINTFDLLVVLFLFAMFILGFMQGTIRRLLGILSILFAFVFAANVRDPLGSFLASEWTHLDPRYAVMIGFGTIFVAASIAFTIAIQIFYKRVPLFEKYTFVDEVLGGTLGVVQGILLLMFMIAILDSGFEVVGLRQVNELPFLRAIHDAYDNSATAALLRSTFIPAFFAILGPFIPGDLKQMFPFGRTG